MLLPSHFGFPMQKNAGHQPVATVAPNRVKTYWNQSKAANQSAHFSKAHSWLYGRVACQAIPNKCSFAWPQDCSTHWSWQRSRFSKWFHLAGHCLTLLLSRPPTAIFLMRHLSMCIFPHQKTMKRRMRMMMRRRRKSTMGDLCRRCFRWVPHNAERPKRRPTPRRWPGCSSIDPTNDWTTLYTWTPSSTGRTNCAPPKCCCQVTMSWDVKSAMLQEFARRKVMLGVPFCSSK